MSRNLFAVAAFAALITLMSCARGAAPAAVPQFTHTSADEWINSPPLTVEKLRGKVVLVEFWTFDCINCLKSAAWVKKVAKEKAGAGLVVIGVHTPELPQERRLDNVRAAVKRLGISYPVMFDGDYSYWNAMGNQYWPAFYLIDSSGRVRGTAIGEMHIGETRALNVERAIDELLAPAS